LKEKGIDASLANLTAEIEERDRRDRNRAAAPLRPAEGARVIDSTDLSINQVLDLVLAEVRQAFPDLDV
jgi:cytidylate kinase